VNNFQGGREGRWRVIRRTFSPANECADAFAPIARGQGCALTATFPGSNPRSLKCEAIAAGAEKASRAITGSFDPGKEQVRRMIAAVTMTLVIVLMLRHRYAVAGGLSLG
jgi:hypothetical protein